MKIFSGGNARFKAAAAAVLFWAAAGVVAVNGTIASFSGNDVSLTAATRLLIVSSSVIGQQAMERAEWEFHGGQPVYEDEAFSNSYFQVLSGRLLPRSHVHLDGRESREMLPWLRAATWADPKNVTNALLTAYWLVRDPVGAKSAMAMLTDAQLHNPDNYLVYMGKGRFFAKADDRARARRYYERALALWPSGMDPRDDDVRMDKREILSRLEVLDELDGDIRGAIGRMMGIVEVLPEKSVLFRHRIGVLLNGETPVESAAERWNALRSEEYHHLCSAEGGNHHPDEGGRDGHEH